MAELPTLQQQERQLNKQRNNKTLETNFKIFNDFLKRKHANFTKATLFLVISFMHQFLSVLRQYKKLVNNIYDANYTVVDSVLSAAQYVDIQSLLNQSTPVFYLIFSICLCFTFGQTIIYFAIYFLGGSYKPRKKLIGKVKNFELKNLQIFQLFLLLSEYFMWLFYFPTVVTFMQLLNCAEVLSCQVDATRSILIVLASLGLFCGFLNIIVLSFFFLNNGDDKKDSLNSEKPIFIALYNVFRFVLALLVCINSDSVAYLWSFIILNILGYGYFMFDMCLGSGYLALATNYTRKLFLFWITVCTSTSLGMLIDEIYRSGNNKEENLTLFFFICMILLQGSVSYNMKYFQTLQVDYDINSLSQSQLQRQIHTLLSMMEQFNTDYNLKIYFQGIIQRHMDFQCKHSVISGEARCFCKKRKLFDSKKKSKDISIDDWIDKDKRIEKVVVKFLLKSWIESYLQKDPTSQQIQILYARFIFKKLKNHQISLQILSQLEKQFTFILDRYAIYQIRQDILKYVKQLNKESYKGKLEIEQALYVEEQIDQIKINIQEILRQNCQFWITLQQSTIDLQEVDLLLQQQFERINATKDLWISITYYLDYKKKWKFYYAWFTTYILNKKVKNRILDNFSSQQVNENDIFSEELQENNLEDDIASIKSGKDNQENEKIEIKSKKIVFDKKACIIQTNDDANAIIIKVNKQFTKIFGYKKEEVIGIMNINQLMPEIYSKVHPEIMSDYKITGKSQALYSQRKIYCIHKQGYMFTAWKFIKIYVDIYGQSQFVVMIRPTDFNNDKKHDYIVINNDWEINGMTQNIIQTLQLDQNIFQKKQGAALINMLLFAPTLIQYSRISRFLKEENLQLFGLAKNVKKDYKVQKSNQSNQIQINIVTNQNSSTLQVKQQSSLRGQLVSDIDITSRNFLPMQSLDVPEQEKQLMPQISSGSDKNEFSEFQSQMGQVNHLENQINREMTLHAQKQIEQKKQELNNYINGQSNQDDEKSEDGFSNDGDGFDYAKFKIQEKQRLKNQNDLIEAGNSITFHVRITDNYTTALQYYSNQKHKLYQIKMQEDNMVKQQEDQDNKKQKKQDLLIKQGTFQKELRKKARLMFAKAAKKQLDDEEKKFYELILEIYDKFFQENKFKKFRMQCTIKFIKVKSERVGVIKVIQISEVATSRRRNIARPSIIPKQMSRQNEFVKLGSLLQKPDLNAPRFSTLTSEVESKAISPLNPTPRGGAGQLIPLTKIQKQNGLGFQVQTEQAEEEDDKDVLLESKGYKKMLNQEAFQHQFKMQQGSQSFSLNKDDNIFQKREDNNKPRKFLIKIAYLTWFLRFMFMTIIALNLLTYFYKPYTVFPPLINQAQRIFDLSQMEIYMIEAYDTVLDLLIYKNADFTQLYVKGVPLQNQSAFYKYEQDQIEIGYQFLKQQMNNVDQQRTFLDQSLFRPQNITDNTIPGKTNLSIILDQKDFFTKFIMLEHEIAEFDSVQLSAISKVQPAVIFMRFITVPYIYDLLSYAVKQLLIDLYNQANNMSNFIIIILILESCIFVIGFFGLLIIIFWICQTYRAVLRLFIKIKKNDLLKISRQQKFIESQFKYLVAKDDEINGVTDKKFSRMNSVQSKQNFQQNLGLQTDEQELNVNKKQEKKILEKKLLRSLTLKMSGAYIVLVVLAATASIVFFMTLKNGATDTENIINAGNVAIYQFPEAQLLLASLKERYLDEGNYQQNYLPPMKAILQKAILDSKSTPQIVNPGFGNYYTGFQQAYYSNTCLFLQQQGEITDDVTMQECLQLSSQKLSYGMVAFNQYYSSLIQDLILDEQSRFGSINDQQIWQFNAAVDFMKLSFKRLLTLWAKDLTDLINSNTTIALILLIIMQIFQLIVFLCIAELYLVSQLNKTFQFYRQVYKNYMPNDIIQKEKIIRAQLIKYNIIKR